MTVHDRPRVPLTRENELDLLLIAAYVKGALDHTQDTYPVGHLEAVARDYVSSVPLPEWGRSIVDKEKRRRIEAIVDDYANGYSPRILREVSALILDICALHTPPPVATATVVDAGEDARRWKAALQDIAEAEAIPNDAKAFAWCVTVATQALAAPTPTAGDK